MSASTKRKVERCTRCRRRMRSIAGWNAVFRRGVAVGLLCPDCQTPEENAEAEINEAGLDYSRMRQLPDGRWEVPEKEVL